MGQYACILALVLLLTGAPAWGASYFVSTSGDNGNDGSVGAPWRTIQHAANTAVAGDTVTVAAGTYTELVSFPNSGTSGSRIVFQGTMSGSTHATIIDGSSPTSGWVTAPEIGSGVWKASLGSPEAMMSNGLTIWKIDNSFMNSTGPIELARAPNAQITIATGQVLAWDGIEALYGNRSGTTFLRFRNGQNPSSMNVRMAPAGGVLTVSSRNNITLRQFKVIGGQYAVRINGSSAGVIVEDSYLTNGRHRVLLENNPQGTIIQRNKITLDHIGMVGAFPCGDRETFANSGSTVRPTNRRRYDVSKFLIGTTEVADDSIALTGQHNNTQLLNNEVYNGVIGIVHYGTGTNTVISGNLFRQFCDIGIYVNADYVSAQAFNNRFQDADHHFRFESTNRNMDYYVFQNLFHNMWYGSGGGGGKHVFIAPPNGTTTSPSKIFVYHNSFAGGGWAVDLGGTSEFSFTFPQLFVRSNLMSTNGFSSGGVNPIPAANRTNNLQTNTWFSNTIPSFIPPGGHAAINGCPSLLATGWPGMTTGYYVDGQPDCGVAQAGQLPSGGIDPPPPPPPDPVVQRPRRTLLIGGW